MRTQTLCQAAAAAADSAAAAAVGEAAAAAAATFVQETGCAHGMTATTTTLHRGMSAECAQKEDLAADTKVGAVLNTRFSFNSMMLHTYASIKPSCMLAQCCILPRCVAHPV